MSHRTCVSCDEWQPSTCYSVNQWRKPEGLSRCKQCLTGTSGNVFLECDRCLQEAMRHCALCEQHLCNDHYSSSQWRRGVGVSRCDQCISNDPNNPDNPENDLNVLEAGSQQRQCAACTDHFYDTHYSYNQWRKGPTFDMLIALIYHTIYIYIHT